MQVLRLPAVVLLAVSIALTGAASPPTRGEERDGGSPLLADGGTVPFDGGASRDPDQEVIDHLDELQRLELLEHLGLFDESGEDEPPPGNRRKSPPPP